MSARASSRVAAASSSTPKKATATTRKRQSDEAHTNEQLKKKVKKNEEDQEDEGEDDEEEEEEDEAEDEEDEEEESKEEKKTAKKKTDTKKKVAADTMSDDEEETPAAVAAASSSSTSASGRSDPSILSFPDSVVGKPLSAYAVEFDRIARSLLCDYDLMSNGTRLRVLEIEFYLKYDEKSGCESHHDLFAHGHPVQKNNFGRWYWHRQGTKPDASYKAGNYKGIDVTFGAVSGGGYGGILLRSIMNVKTGEVIEGSCLVANKILETHKTESIVDLVKTWKGDTSAFTGPTLYFTPSASPIAPKAGTAIMLKSARVGLTLKQSGVTRQQYILQPYRYTMQVKGACFNKKMKQTILLSVYEELGSSRLSELCTLLGCTRAYADKLIAQFQAGKALATGMKKFVDDNKKDLNTDSMAQMYGAWMKLYAQKPYIAVVRA